jgi:hypothetical protein
VPFGQAGTALELPLRWCGSIQNASIRLAARAAISTTGSTSSTAPSSPARKESGSEHRHRGEERREHPGQHLARALDHRLQRRDVLPAWAAMLSVITTASSMTMPMAISSATRVIMLSDSPVRP